MVFTGNGDKGYTDLFEAEKKVPKNGPDCEVLGELDELNSFLGHCKVRVKDYEERALLETGERSISSIIHDIQNDVFIIQAQLAGAPKEIKEENTEKLERWIITLQENFPAPTTFSVPGEDGESVYFDMTRTICRRVERGLLGHYGGNPVFSTSEQLKYLNRLSDLLYCIKLLLVFKLGCEKDTPNY